MCVSVSVTPGCSTELLGDGDSGEVEESDGDDGHADGHNEQAPVIKRFSFVADGGRRRQISRSIRPRQTFQCQIQGILKGEYHCTVDLLFDWFGIRS